MKKVASFCAAVFLSTLFAVFGTAAVDAIFSRLYRPHSGTTAIVKAWSLDSTVAAVLGLILRYSRKDRMGTWAWLIPTTILICKALSYTSSFDAFFAHFSGRDCGIELQGISCTDFFIFTIPFIRGVAYSLASRLGSALLE